MKLKYLIFSTCCTMFFCVSANPFSSHPMYLNPILTVYKWFGKPICSMGIIYFCSVRQSGCYPFFRFSSFLKLPFFSIKKTYNWTQVSSILSNNTIIMYNSQYRQNCLTRSWSVIECSCKLLHSKRIRVGTVH